jgi:hypothetical protein
VHRRPVDNLDQIFAELGSIVAERAIGVEGPIRENDFSGAFDTPDEARHRTEVCCPIFRTTTGVQP